MRKNLAKRIEREVLEKFIEKENYRKNLAKRIESDDADCNFSWCQHH